MREKGSGMKKSRKGMTLKEASEYWDEHDFFESGEPKEVKVDVRIDGSDHYVLLESSVARKVRSLARRKRKTERAIVNQLLRESLRHVV